MIRGGAAFAVCLATGCSQIIGIGDLSTPPPRPAAAFGSAITVASSVNTDPEAGNVFAAGDIDGDGRADLVVARSSQVSVLINGTAKGGDPQLTDVLDVATFGGAVFALADVNGDHRPDLVIGSSDAMTVSVALNTTATGGATPTFAAAETFSVGGNPVGLAIGDLDGNGKPDLVVTVTGATTAAVALLNTTATGATTPTFGAAAKFPCTGPHGVVLADFDGDGKLDVAVSNSTMAAAALPDSIDVFLNHTATGAATAQLDDKVEIAAPGLELAELAAADLNGDALPDLVVDANGTLGVLTDTTPAGATAATFAMAALAPPIAVTACQYSIADVNGDALPDIAIAASATESVDIVSGQTATQLVANVAVDTPDATAVLLLDVDGDGKLDLVIGESDGGVQVALQQ